MSIWWSPHGTRVPSASLRATAFQLACSAISVSRGRGGAPLPAVLVGGDPAACGDLALKALESVDEGAQPLEAPGRRVRAGDGGGVQAVASLDEERVDALGGAGIEAVGAGLFAAGEERGA